MFIYFIQLLLIYLVYGESYAISMAIVLVYVRFLQMSNWRGMSGHLAITSQTTIGYFYSSHSILQSCSKRWTVRLEMTECSIRNFTVNIRICHHCICKISLILTQWIFVDL